MVRITEDLVRKRAEHNNLELSTLEEVSLHQQDIERIENIDKWCRELKILYLQSNLIPTIENVSRLKKLVYLNLALNNVERVENLESCESLEKLDLTVNFVGELTSIECLKNLHHFKELFLTGNPCTQFEGYRDYVIATLPHLQHLDGTEVEKSERIKAVQNCSVVTRKIVQQQQEYRRKREAEKEEAKQEEEKKKAKKNKPGFDGRWYTDMNQSEESTDKSALGDGEPDENGKVTEDSEEKEAEFWQEKTAFTPESRLRVHEHMQEKKKKEEKKNAAPPKKPRTLFNESGKPLNVNEAKIDFSFTEDTENNSFVLDLAIFKHMDTSLVDVDVQTNYVRVVLKGKIFQLELMEEVNPDSSTAKRSQITGHLLITIPKAKAVIKTKQSQQMHIKKENKENEKKDSFKSTVEKLEVDPSVNKCVDISNIVTEKIVPPMGSQGPRCAKERPNSDDFVDNPDVPPLM